jgi:hypothetical protein
MSDFNKERTISFIINLKQSGGQITKDMFDCHKCLKYKTKYHDLRQKQIKL